MPYLFMMREYWKYAVGERAKIVLIYIIYIINVTLDVCVPLVFAQILNTIQTSLKIS